MKNKKILIILSLVLLILTLNFSCCFASSDIPSIHVDDYSYYFVFSYSGNTFLITTSNTDFPVGASTSFEDCTIFYLKSSQYNSYILSDNSWSSCDLSTYNLVESDGRIVFKPGTGLQMMHSNFDLKYDSYWSGILGEEFFFLLTPHSVIRVKVMGVEMAKPVMTTIVGLVKLLIPLLIFLVGFWKAWAFLSKTLRQA